MYDDLFKKVLIVEDDLTYRNPLNSYLAARGFAVSTADDGEQAMEKILVHLPDVIILDLLLPKVDGFEVLKRIRGYPQAGIANTPVIILSNLSSGEDVEKAQKHNISAFFVKSHTNFEEVVKKVQEILFKGASSGKDEIWDFTKE